MKNFLLAFFVFLIYSDFGMWYHDCIIIEVCTDSVFESEPNEISKDMKTSSDTNTTDPTSDISISNESSEQTSDDVLFDFPDNLRIVANEPTVVFPDGQNAFKESIFSFMNENQDKELIVTGLFNSDEAQRNDQIGKQRASFIKDLLVNFGINENRVSIDSKLSDIDYDAAKAYRGGILFRFNDISDIKKKAIESDIVNKTLYSGFGSKEFRADNTLQAYALELKNYLENYPGKTANIIGHTDSVGDNLANDWYGMERAKNVKQYLVSMGIPESKLFASSKGETQPIASNGTIEGRRKNRRIEIKVK